MPKVKINLIKPDPNQPRKHFSDEYIEKLAGSLKQEGMIHPVEIDSTNMLIVGECRWKAARLLGWEEIPVTIHEGELSAYQRLRRQMNENLVRTSSKDNEQMNPMDVAGAYATLLTLAGYKYSPGKDLKRGRLGNGLTQIAKETGVAVTTVHEYLELLKKSKSVQASIKSGGIPRTVFRTINSLPEAIRDEFEKDVIKNWGSKYRSRDDVRRHVTALKAVSPDIRNLIAEHSKLRKDGIVSQRLVNKIIELGVVVGEVKEEEIHTVDFNVVIHHIEWIQTELNKFKEGMFKSLDSIEMLKEGDKHE